MNLNNNYGFPDSTNKLGPINAKSVKDTTLRLFNEPTFGFIDLTRQTFPKSYKPTNSLLDSIWAAEPFNGPTSSYIKIALGLSEPKPSTFERYKTALFGTNDIKDKDTSNLPLGRLLGQNYSGLIKPWNMREELRNAERELAYFDTYKLFTLCDPSAKDAAKDAVSRYKTRMAQIDKAEQKYLTSFEQACKAGLIKVSDIETNPLSLSGPFWNARVKAQEELDATISKDVQIDLAFKKILEKKKRDITSLF